jgi:hypothetical protein
MAAGSEKHGASPEKNNAGKMADDGLVFARTRERRGDDTPNDVQSTKRPAGDTGKELRSPVDGTLRGSAKSKSLEARSRAGRNEGRPAPAWCRSVFMRGRRGLRSDSIFGYY